MKRYFTHLNIVFTVNISLTLLVSFGFMPREFSFLVLAIYLSYLIFASLRSNVELFLRSIPFFIALPLAVSFDNFSTWRIVLALIFLRWALEKNRYRAALSIFFSWQSFRRFLRENRLEVFGIIFLLISAGSILVGVDYVGGIKRLIFLGNAALLFVILRSLISEDEKLALRFAKSFSYSAILAVLFGFLQFFSAYFAPAWIFHYWWGQVVSINMYGREWGNIVTNFGNTWFSYSGDTLRLRMFSIFADSHSFPMYVIMALPALGLILWQKARPLRKNWLWLSATAVTFSLALILSGTRGIWLGSVATIGAAGILWFLKEGRVYSKVLFGMLAVFIASFSIYFAVVSFPQFQETTFESGATFGRIRSLIDFSETSNQGRIYIWKETIAYIIKNPVWGIGLANYPLILSEPLSASLAGASAHNLYLHIAATSGIAALSAFFAFIFILIHIAIDYIRRAAQNKYAPYMALLLFSVAWIGAYSLTDAALFDGHALLAFMAMTGIAAGLHLRNKKASVSDS